MGPSPLGGYSQIGPSRDRRILSFQAAVASAEFGAAEIASKRVAWADLFARVSFINSTGKLALAHATRKYKREASVVTARRALQYFFHSNP